MKILVAGLCAFLLGSSVAYGQDMHSLWMDKPVTVDGNPNEWPQPFRYYDTETKLQYSVANDTGFIYVCLKLTDESAQMRLFRSGLNIWIDPKGKKKETVGITFPMKVERQPGDGGGERRQRQPGEAGFQKPDVSKLKQRVLLQQIALKITGFGDVPDQVLPLQNGFGINAALDWDSLNILCIEYKIPIKSALKHGLTASDTVKPIGLGFVINAGEMNTHGGGENHSDEEMMDNNSSMRGMNGNGGYGGGGMGGGMNSGNREGWGGGGSRGGMGGNTGFGSMATDQKVWSRLILAWR